MFIVIDWIDWAWKSTQMKLILEKLEKINKKVKTVSYPRYSEDSSFLVKKYLNWEYWDQVSAKQASVFYAVDRFDSSTSLKKDIQNYDYVISDRYASANMLHQAWKIKDYKQRNEFLDWLYDFEYNILKIPVPDRVLFLNISSNLSIKNMYSRWIEDKEYLKEWKKLDIHEQDKNHLENACSIAQDVLKKYSNWIKIECEEDWKLRSIEEINKDIMKEILKKV